MPRRTRGHIYRKREATPAPSRSRAHDVSTTIEPSTDGEAEAVVTGLEAEAAPAPYVRRQTFTTARSTPAMQTPARSSRTAATDYGYVVSELKRIGLTFGGLVILLIVVARLLR